MPFYRLTTTVRINSLGIICPYVGWCYSESVKQIASWDCLAPNKNQNPLNGSYWARVWVWLTFKFEGGFMRAFFLFSRHSGRSWEATRELVGCWALTDPLAILVLPMKVPEELPRRQLLLPEKHPLQPGICPVIALQEKVNSSLRGLGGEVDGAWLSSVGVI